MRTSTTKRTSLRLALATAALALGFGVMQTAAAHPWGGGPGAGGCAAAAEGGGPGPGPCGGTGPGAGHHGGRMMGGGMMGGSGMGMMGGGGPGMMGGGGMGMMGGGGMPTWMLDSVKATPEQKAQIEKIMTAARTDMQATRASRHALRQQQRTLLAQPTIDAAAAETLRQQIQAQQDQASKRMLQARIEAANVLSPEQRKQISERMGERQAMMARHRAEREAAGFGPGGPRQ